ncbi:hypothetical protein [Neobacillus soli]|uniref:hypothetical protein n=1 Tax=Neobacillus soli TaxID=220688 RepID=UPI0008257C7B|nr:hypothetical protein [Neobacillus soli]
MKKKTKNILISLIVLIVLVIALNMAVIKVLDTVFGGACGNQIVKKLPSPSGDKVAYVFNRDCGATTGSSPQLSILNKDDKFPNKSGNTFRANESFSIEWLNKKNLKVIYDKSSKTYEMDKRVNRVNVEYFAE